MGIFSFLFGDDDTSSSEPVVNIDGTPMLPGGLIDTDMKLYGEVDADSGMSAFSSEDMFSSSSDSFSTCFDTTIGCSDPFSW